MIKKIFKLIAFLLIAIIIAAVAIPYFYKDEIIENVKTEINNNLNAKVDFEDVNLSLFKNFPDFNFSLDKLSISGINEFEGHQLVDAENIEFSLDFMSVVSTDKPLEINSVSLEKPVINVKVLRNGKANFDIVKTNNTPANEDATEDLNFLIHLKKYKVTDGEIVYDDRLDGNYIKILDLDHVGKGEFTQDIFDITTTTSIGSLTAKSGGVTYLSKAKADLDLTINADLPNSKYTIKENSIVLNALKLNTEGFVQTVGDNIKMDIKYGAPKNDFKNLLSMIPSAFTKDFKDVQATGTLDLNGYVKGVYDSKNEALPSFLLNLTVENGEFKYPDLPLGIKGINTAIKINSPSSDLNKMVVDISNFKMELGNNPFQANAKLWTLLTDPNIDSEIDGTIDLAELAKAFPMDGVSKLNGIITSNLKASTSMSAIDGKDYENIDMIGDIRVQDLVYESKETPSVQVTDMKMNFSPKYVKLDNLEAKIGKSDLKAEGTIDNILAYFSPEKTMKGNIIFRSDFIDADEWISAEEETSEQNDVSITTSTTDDKVFDRFDFTVDGEIKTMQYDIYELKDSRLVGNITPNKVDLREFKTKVGESDFEINGKITNVFNYLYENETLKGDINLNSEYINANEFMIEEGEISAEESIVFPVPEKMDIDLNANIGEVLYTNIPLKAINGKIKVKNETATIYNGKAKTLGGNVVMNGSYNTQNINEPKFDMDYKVSSLNYQEAFDKLNTFQALAPIGKYIEGKFNTTIKMSGILGKDMLPDMTTLSADGFLQTLDGTLKNFEPVQQFANKLNLDFLNSVNLKNTKNWFEIKNGEIKVKDFDYSTNGIDMVIGGSHGLDSDMSYNIKAKVPRKILQKNAAGQAADKGLNFLQGQASKLGINLDQGEFVNVNALITGSMTNPKIKLNLLGTDGEASIDKIVDEVKKQVVDKVSNVIEDKTGVDVQNIEEEIEEVKEDLSAKADAEISTLMKKTEANIKKINDEAKKRSDETKSEAQKLSDKTRAEGYKQADALIEKAGSNIFKKKAAEIAAKKLKEETDKKAEQIIGKGDDAANTIIETAEKQTNKLKVEADKLAEGIRAKYK